MKKALLAALAMSLAATIAYAQTDSQPPAPPSPPAAGAPDAGAPDAAPPPPPPGPDAMHERGHEPGRMRGPDAMGGPGGMMGRPGGMMGRPGHHGPGGWHGRHGMMMGSKAAHFRIKSGDMSIDVKCADGDSTAACGQTVIQLLDKLQSQAGDDEQGGDDSMMNE